MGGNSSTRPDALRLALAAAAAGGERTALR
jgi:hypothetical protein